MDAPRRRFLGNAAASGLALAVPLTTYPAPAHAASNWRKRLTGADLDTFHRWRVGGTDLGIAYVLENGSIGYLFGDSFDTPSSDHVPNDWRSPVMLRSAVHPGAPGGIVFDSAARVAGDGRAPDLMYNGHIGRGPDGTPEFTVIPNDGIAFAETGRQIVSYMSIDHWDDRGVLGPKWRSHYAGLAYSDNGNDFVRTPLKWWNTPDNLDPFQMWTLQRDGDQVYIFSVRAGRQWGPMMLRRVHYLRLFDPAAYEGWGWNGRDWGWGRPCTGLFWGVFGEPSVRRLDDGVWAMSYLNAVTGCIVTRTAAAPDRVWSEEKVQITSAQEPGLYGGFIHPWSRSGTDQLHLLVSKWLRPNGVTTHYHVSQYLGTL